MKILITGSNKGIGHAIATKFLDEGHEVLGVDVLDSDDILFKYEKYSHLITTIEYPYALAREKKFLNELDILVNNAGVQTAGEKEIEINLLGTVRFTEYILKHSRPKCIINIASVSAHNGSEFPYYAASKGGILSYTKNVALRCAEWGGRCNSISPGGVITDLNRPVMDDDTLWNEIMNETPLKKWATPQEIAEWTYFMSVVDKSTTGQDIIIDNGETINCKFVWPQEL